MRSAVVRVSVLRCCSEVISGEGCCGEGVSGDGCYGKGVSGEGCCGKDVSGEGCCGEGCCGKGVSGEGCCGKDVSGEGAGQCYKGYNCSAPYTTHTHYSHTTVTLQPQETMYVLHNLTLKCVALKTHPITLPPSHEPIHSCCPGHPLMLPLATNLP